MCLILFFKVVSYVNSLLRKRKQTVTPKRWYLSISLQNITLLKMVMTSQSPHLYNTRSAVFSVYVIRLFC